MKAFLQRIQSILGRLAQNRFAFPAFLLFVGVVSYLLQINRMGFYWDDWQAVLLSRSSDPGLVWRYFAFDRPFSAWTYALTFPLIQMHAPLWHILNLLLRWAGVLCLYGTFIELWPDWRSQWKWMAILVLVYPTFTLQSIAVAFSQHFFTFALSALSLYLMVHAIRHRRRYWVLMPLAWVACGVSLFTMEYFVGLEALRYIILGVLIFGSWKITRPGLRSFILNALPFLLILGGYLYYRLVLYPAQLGAITTNSPTLLATGISGLLTLMGNAGSDGVYLLFGVWSGIYANINLQSSAFLTGWALGIVLALLAVMIIRAGSSSLEADARLPRSSKLLFGLFAILVGGLPVWSLGQQIIIGKYSGRYSLAPMIGAAVVVVWLVEQLIRTRFQRNILLAVLAAFSIATQVQAINLYRKDWDVQRKLYWQLTWRAPALKDGTALIAPGVSPLTRQGNYQVWYALNALYHPEDAPDQLKLGFFTLQRLEGDPAYSKGQPLHYQVRNFSFDGNTSQALAYYFDPGQGCLRVLDAVYAGDPTLPAEQADLLPISDVSQVEPNAQSQPLKQIFGAEPAHDWCYIFEKADLARQQGDWDGILAMVPEEGPSGLHPKHGVELAPFMEAFANRGRWDWLLEASRQAMVTTPKLSNWVCKQWKRLATDSVSQSFLQQANSELSCRP